MVGTARVALVVVCDVHVWATTASRMVCMLASTFNLLLMAFGDDVLH
jgi:hypothetical protein